MKRLLLASAPRSSASRCRQRRADRRRLGAQHRRFGQCSHATTVTTSYPAGLETNTGVVRRVGGLPQLRRRQLPTTHTPATPATGLLFTASAKAATLATITVRSQDVTDAVTSHGLASLDIEDTSTDPVLDRVPDTRHVLLDASMQALGVEIGHLLA